MRVAVTGASGLIGSALTQSLRDTGDEVVLLVRSRDQAGGDAVFWDPEAGTIDTESLGRLDAAVHLSGETVAGMWTKKKKEKIRSSRVRSTVVLSEALAGLDPAPKVFVCASAVGYYGDRGDEELTERSGPGSGFLVDVVRDWEAATATASNAGIRVVNVRTAIVLSPRGGALGTMLVPFRLGLGGRLGSGRQWMSWVAIDDEIGVIRHALAHEAVTGPINATSPNPVTNREFTKALGRVLGRPTVFPAPARVLKAVLGEFAEEGLLAGQRAIPERALASGYRFEYPELEPALRHVLGRE
jgi:uncharacterized protein (TIGR01777 family)